MNISHLNPAAGAYERMCWLLLAVFCAFGLFDHSLWSSNDTREGAMIREMVRENIWVAPSFNGQYYLEKPPLLHWTAVVFCRMADRVNEGLVRLPAALFGFGALLLIGAWARALGQTRAGLPAAFMCATSALYFEYSRIVLTDAALTCAVILALYLFWRGYSAKRFAWYVFLPFLVVSALAFYAKGLIGPGLIWVAVALFLCIRREWKLIFGLGFAFALIFTVSLLPWVWALWKTGGMDFLHGVFWENQFGRFLAFNDPALPLDPYYVHKESIFYYLKNIPLRLLPWTLLVLPALWHWFRPGRIRRDPAALFVRTALLGMLAVLHLSSAKAACYSMPVFPVLFLMTGVWLADSLQNGFSQIERRLIWTTFGILAGAVLLAPLAYVVMFASGLSYIWAPGRSAALAGLGLAVMTLTAGFWSLRRILRKIRAGQQQQSLFELPIVLTVLGMLGAAIYTPVLEYQRSYVPLTDAVRVELEAGRRMALAGMHERNLGALMFYLDRRFDVVSTTNAHELNAFWDAAGGASGLVVSEHDLQKVQNGLEDKEYIVRPVPHDGKKSREFRLLLAD